jgi:hypothetical protein
VVGGLGCGWAKLNVVFLCRLVRWQNTSFNFAKRWHFRPLFLSVYVCTFGRPTLAGNVTEKIANPHLLTHYAQMKQTTRCGEPESECRDEVAELKTFYSE